MIDIEIDKGVVDIQANRLERLMTDNPEIRKGIQGVISENLWKARNDVVNSLVYIFKNGDPAEARRAVRRVVYESILGGNLNIRNMRRGKARWKVRQIERKVDRNPGMRGGNRRRRSFETIRMQGYEGKARGMILRWVNGGTDGRSIKFKSDSSRRVDKWNKHPNTGNRGSIRTRNFFKTKGELALSVAAEGIARMIEEEMQKAINNKQQ